MPRLLSNHPVTSISRCANFLRKFNIRSFSTTSVLAQIRPEHPYFIDVPGQAPFRRRLAQNQVKGTLPVPRNVLKTRALATPKHHRRFRQATIPEPRYRGGPKNKYSAWKSRMAASRRKNLREAIAELHQRSEEKKKHHASVSEGNRKRRERLLHARQREDERLTNPTIRALNSTPQSGILPDPDRKARLKAKAARLKLKQEAKIKARQSALHNLYMNARDFITTEAQLNAKIEEIFTDKPFNIDDDSDNIWEVFGSPPTIQDMVRSAQGKTKAALEVYQSPAVITGDRLRNIAEELTGGKIETAFDQKIPS